MLSMNSKERVAQLLSGNVPDRVPLSLTASLYGAALTQCTPREYFTRPEAYLQGQERVAGALHPDILFTPFAMALFAQAYGAGCHFPGQYPPNVSEYVAFTPGEKIALKVEQALAHPAMNYLESSAAMLTKSLGQSKILAGILISPVDLPALIVGVEKWLHTLLFFREQAIDIIVQLSPFCTAMAQGFAAAGIDVIVVPANFTNHQIVTRPISAGITMPAFTEWLAGLPLPVVFHHGGPDILRMFPEYAGLPSVAGYVPSAIDNLLLIRGQIGSGSLLIGNIDGPFLQRSTPADIRLKCLKILTENTEKGAFILGTSNADISYSTPLANILALHESILEFNVKREKQWTKMA